MFKDTVEEDQQLEREFVRANIFISSGLAVRGYVASAKGNRQMASYSTTLAIVIQLQNPVTYSQPPIENCRALVSCADVSHRSRKPPL